mgnify:CR=1 FL=1
MDYLEQRRKLRQMVQERLDYGRDYTDEEVEDTIDEVLMEQENLELCSVELRRRLRKELFDSLRRLDILQIFVDDSSVTEIMINGLDHIFVERDGQLQELDRAFDSMEKLQDVIQQIVAGCNRVVNEASPIVDARLSNGARVNIVMSPIALNGPIITIRRFPDKPITMQKLIAMETISPEAADFLKTLDKKQLKNGYGEILKYRMLDGEVDAVARQGDLQKTVVCCANFKQRIVQKDPFDNNERKILNFGHTVGHAMELSLKLPHGEAVANGLYYETLLAYKTGLTDARYLQHWTLEIKNIFPVRAFQESMIPLMTNDKKNSDGKVCVILPHNGVFSQHFFTTETLKTLLCND